MTVVRLRDMQTVDKRIKKGMLAGILCLIALIAVGLLYLMQQETAQEVAVTSVAYQTCKDRLFYEPELAESWGDTFAQNLDVLEEYVSRTYPDTCWYISFVQHDSSDAHQGERGLLFMCYEMAGDVVIQQNRITLITDGNTVSDKIVYSYQNWNPGLIPEGERIGEARLNEIVLEQASSYYGGTPIHGKYQMAFTQEQKLIYDVWINEYSNLEIDAFTGEVLKTFLWDGVIDD